MKEFAIFTDSSSDMFTPLRKRYNVEYVQMYIKYKGADVPASLDWGEFYTERELWDEIETKNRITTSQVNEATYVEAFTEFLEKGKDILYIACSSGLSQSINSARKARETLLEKYPDSTIYTIDALIACKGLTAITIQASLLRDEGKTIDEVAEWIESNKIYYHQWGTVDDLGYLKRAGRVTGAAAFFGGILQVKPIIVADAKGQNAAIIKARGRKASMKVLADAVKDYIKEPENQTVYICHGDCIEDANALAATLKESVNPKEIYIDWLGPIIGSSTGKGMLAVYFCGSIPDFRKE